MLGIYAEGVDPRNFGFDFTENELKIVSRKMRGEYAMSDGRSFYEPIQEAMRKNVQKSDLPKAIRWFYHANLSKVGNASVFVRAYRKLRMLLRIS